MSDRDASVTTLIASFDGPDAAREAMVAAERAGLDSDHIHLQSQPAPTSSMSIERDGELTALDDGASRSVVGGVVGGVALAAIAVVVVLILGPDPLGVALVLAAIGGGIAGFLLGGFWSGAAGLPTNPEALDTYTIDPADARPVVVAFTVGGGRVDAAQIEQLCHRHGATDVARRAA